MCVCVRACTCVLGAGMKPWHCNHSLMTGCYLTPTFKWMQKIHTDEQLAYFSMPGCVCSIATVSRMPFEPSGFSVHHRFPLPIWVWSIGILFFFRRDVFFYVTEKNKCFHLIFFFCWKQKIKSILFLAESDGEIINFMGNLLLAVCMWAMPQFNLLSHQVQVLTFRHILIPRTQ